jgi:UDP-N-acetylmuramoylalanine--D-glutamate ligase
LSPGVPCKDNLLCELINSPIPIYSEIELGYWFCKGKIIGVTGSNGKSTTATLVYELFRDSGKRSHLAGNIGLPFTQIVENIREDDIVVLELSSFQLERIASFSPYVSVILNLTPDHLDRYPSVQKYYEAKLNIWMNQDENSFSVIRRDDPNLFAYADRCPAKQIWFARERFDLYGVYAYDGSIKIVDNKGYITEVLKVEDLVLRGPHNQWNACAAVASTIPFGLPLDSVRKTLKRFSGIEHRIEFVRELDGVKFFNDSKSTNPDSLFWALQSFTEPIILIAGGLDKGTDFTPLKKLVEEKVRLAILIGKAKDKLRESWDGATEILFANDMLDAVEKAHRMANSGEVVLLSPGCASFDMFNNFEHRGKVFKEIVQKLKSKYETGTR